MKTTVDIPDALFRQAKPAAAERGVSLRLLISEALSEKLHPQESEDKPNSSFGHCDCVPVIVLGEYRYGVKRSRNR